MKLRDINKYCNEDICVAVIFVKKKIAETGEIYYTWWGRSPQVLISFQENGKLASPDQNFDT